MKNKLFIGLTPEGYSVSLAPDQRGARYEPVLRRGKNVGDVIHSLMFLPDDFYKDGVKIEYGSESCPFPVPDIEKQRLEDIVTYFENSARQRL